MSPSFQPVADTGLLVGFGTVATEALNRQVIALDHALSKAAFPGHLESVPALVNLLVVFDPMVTDHATLETQIRGLLPLPASGAKDARTHQVPVCYDAELCPDLLRVSEATHLSPDDVIAAHLEADFTVAMYGFAPGYAYMSGVPEQIHVPRKTAAVRDVPKGSVMIAGAQSLITTITMPTGWSIIGRSPCEIIRKDADNPFLFDVGDHVSFTRIARADLPAGMQTP